MRAALRKLLEGIIDYAGLFPPAKLGMKEAVSEYWDKIHSSDGWIVSRFVCPSDRLDEFAHVFDDFVRGRETRVEPIGITLVGPRTIDAKSFEAKVQHDFELIQKFNSEMGGTALVEGYEIRKPPGVAALKAAKALDAFRELDVFVEIDWNEDVPEQLHQLAQSDWLGAKARTGGETASDFPSSEKLASFLKECLSLDLQFKLTAGLHDPIRHTDPLLGADRHGFLNVLVAAALVEENDLNRKQITSILNAKDAGLFGFDSVSATFKDFEAESSSIEDMRSLFICFGCCSIDDPLDGLAKLKLLEVARS